MNAADRSRVPAGVSTGGRFAPEPRGRPEVRLDEIQSTAMPPSGQLVSPVDLHVGDVFQVSGSGGLVVAEIIGEKEPHEDRFGQKQFKYMARRPDTGVEGYMIYGPGAVDIHLVRRGPRGALEDGLRDTPWAVDATSADEDGASYTLTSGRDKIRVSIEAGTISVYDEVGDPNGVPVAEGDYDPATSDGSTEAAALVKALEPTDEDEDEKCRVCQGPNSDGEGYDGMCGSCADVAEDEGHWS